VSANDGPTKDRAGSTSNAVGRELMFASRWNDRVAGVWNPSRWVDKSTEIFNYSWPPFVGGGDTSSPPKDTLLPPGNYEWPFELVIDGSTPETIEGFTSSYITYRLEATVRRGKMGCDLHTHKPVRIVRTLGPAALELAHPMTVECLWSDKVDCQISIPQKGVIFGTEITMQMKITPLLKGLRIGTVRCLLFEHQEFTVVEVAEPSLLRVRVVDSWTFEPNDEDDMLGGDCPDEYTLERVLLLPKRLSKCVPDADACGIKVRHRVRASLDIHNPDGHISEVSSLNTVAECLQV
jgi:arrestin-related trafficking adapter 4/5/7